MEQLRRGGGRFCIGASGSDGGNERTAGNGELAQCFGEVSRDSLQQGIVTGAGERRGDGGDPGRCMEAGDGAWREASGGLTVKMGSLPISLLITTRSARQEYLSGAGFLELQVLELGPAIELLCSKRLHDSRWDQDDPALRDLALPLPV